MEDESHLKLVIAFSQYSYGHRAGTHFPLLHARVGRSACNPCIAPGPLFVDVTSAFTNASRYLLFSPEPGRG
eukprot:12916225-Prorocentrum_lima.AAC.1